MGSVWWLVPLGFVVGAYGTLIGAGGGFVLVPILALLYPADSPELLTSISLAVVFFNALSGSAAYARMGRIDYRSGGVFAIATIPGAILGALVTPLLPRRLFDGVLGLLLMVGSIVLLAGGRDRATAPGARPAWAVTRSLVEADGTCHTYAYNQPLGVGLSLVVGFLSSLLGIGGGIIHVPALCLPVALPGARRDGHLSLCPGGHGAGGDAGPRCDRRLCSRRAADARSGHRRPHRRAAWRARVEPGPRRLDHARARDRPRVYRRAGSLTGACPLSLSTPRHRAVGRPSRQKRTTERAAPTPTIRRRSTFRQSASQAAPINAHVFQSTSASRAK